MYVYVCVRAESTAPGGSYATCHNSVLYFHMSPLYLSLPLYHTTPTHIHTHIHTYTHHRDCERLVLYLKDINLPRPDQYDTCQLIAFLQQIITFGGFYDEALGMPYVLLSFNAILLCHTIYLCYCLLMLFSYAILYICLLILFSYAICHTKSVFLSFYII
jgi:hypothetical protein